MRDKLQVMENVSKIVNGVYWLLLVSLRLLHWRKRSGWT